MKRSKEFIIRRQRFWPSSAQLNYLSGHPAVSLCYRSLVRHFGFKLKPGEKKRIRITIEEIEK